MDRRHAADLARTPRANGTTIQRSWIAAIPILLLTSLLAGTPVLVPMAGRHLPLGPTELFLAIIMFLLPSWWRRLPPITLATAAAYAFVLWCLASALFWSVDMRRSVLTAVDLLEAATVFVVCYNCFISSRRTTFSLAIRVFNLILALQLVLVVVSTVNELGAVSFFGFKDRIVVPIGQNNFVALFLEFGILYEVLARRRGWLIVAPVLMVALLLTLSRGAIVSLGLTLSGAALLAAVVPGERQTGLVVLVVASLGAVLLQVLPIGAVLVQAFDVVGRSVAAREALWSTAMSAVAHAPLTGIGFGAFESVSLLREAHSTAFALLAETGVVGFALFTTMMAAVLGRMFARLWEPDLSVEVRREYFALTVALSGVVVHSMIEPFFFGRSAIWTACVLAWTVVVSARSPAELEGVPREGITTPTAAS